MKGLNDMAGKRVLVVDDEKLIVKGIRFSLEQDDMEVDCAYDGEEALQYARNNQYDIILLDVMLPKLTGFEVCQQIREFSNVPIIMLTARDDDMDKILGLEYGADDYITKPFSILEVKARIKAIMRRVERGKAVCLWWGLPKIRAMCEQWMSISAVCVRKSKKAPVNLSMCIQNGVWAIITKMHKGCEI